MSNTMYTSAGAPRNQPMPYNAEANRAGDQPLSVGTRPTGNNFDRESMFKDVNLFPYFGLSRTMMPPAASYDGLDQENYDLPDAYVGSNNFLRNIIIDQVQAVNMWGTGIALPWKKWEGGNEINWDTWVFNETLMTRTPEEAVSRMLSSHFESSRAFTVRYGIALIMEHGFFSTAMGREHYALQLIQIRNAICVTAQHGVVIALLHPPKFIDPYAKYRTMAAKNRTAIAAYFRCELREWGCFNRHQDGWVIELDILDSALRERNQVTGDMIIVPMGSKKFINDQPVNKYHFLSGGMYKALDETALKADGRLVIESVPQAMGEHEASYDPCFREQTIGTFFQMLDSHLLEVPLKEFKTSMLDTIIFSECLDDFYRIQYRSAVAHMGLYSGWEDEPSKVGDMPITQDLGRLVFRPGQTWGTLLKSANKLELFVKQLVEHKNDSVLIDFCRKFILPPQLDSNKMSPHDETDYEKAARNDVQKAVSEYLLDFKGGSFAAPTHAGPRYGSETGPHHTPPVTGHTDEAHPAGALKFQGVDLESAVAAKSTKFIETPSRDRELLLRHMTWLSQLDDAAKNQGISSHMASQVAQVVLESHGYKKLIESAPTLLVASAILHKMILVASAPRLIAYALDVATAMCVAQQSESPLEQYVKQKSSEKTWSSLTLEDTTAMTHLNEISPYWRPVKDSVGLAVVSIVCPEDCLGDRALSDTRVLGFASEALTLTTKYIVLFGLRPAQVAAMLEAGTSTLLNLTINFDQSTAVVNQAKLSDRLALLQFSVVISAMYQLLGAFYEKCRRKPPSPEDRVKHVKQLMRDWVSLAKAEHVLNRDHNIFKTVIHDAAMMLAMPLQASMDGLIVQLRDCLITLYTANLAGTAVDVKQLTESIDACETNYAYCANKYHVYAIANEKQAAPGDQITLGQVEPTNHSFLLTIHGQPGSFDRYQKPMPTGNQLQREAARVQAVEGRQQEMKAAFIEISEVLKAKHGVDTTHSSMWMSTYIKLKEHLVPNVFHDLYLNNNEYFIKDFSPSLVDYSSLLTHAKLILEIDVGRKYVAKLFGSETFTTYVEIYKDVTKKAMDNYKSAPVGMTMAFEWTRLFYEKLATIMEFFRDASQDETGQSCELETLASVAVIISLALTQQSRVNLADDCRQWIKNTAPQNERVGSNLQGLIVNQVELERAHAAATVIPDGERDSIAPLDAPKIAKRPGIDLIRTVLLDNISMDDGYFWQWSIENDMVQSIGALCEKPHCRYEMGTMIILSAFGKTGYTFYGRADMMLSDNAATKMHYGHFTYNSKPVVLNEKNIIHGRNVLCRAYLGGNDHLMYNAGDPADLEDYNAGVINKSIFVVPVMMNYRVDTTHRDITGTWSSEIGADTDAKNMTYHAAAPIYAAHWGWRNNANTLLDMRYNVGNMARNNTIVFQEHQFLYNWGSKKFDIAITHKGHWGDRIYPGCSADRTMHGGDRYLKPVKYSNTATMAIIQ